MDYDAYDALLHHIFKRTQEDAWFKPTEENVSAGVCLRVETGVFRVFPYENRFLEPFEAAVRVLNPVVAVKIRSAAVHSTLASLSAKADWIQIDSQTQIQVLDTMDDLGTADKEQQGAFIRDERVLVAWSDHIDGIVPLCKEFENKLIKRVWAFRPSMRTLASSSTLPASSSASTATGGSGAGLNEKAVFEDDEDPTKESAEAPPPLTARDAPKPRSKWSFFGGGGGASASADPEKADTAPKRPMRLFAPVYGGLGCALSLFYIGSGANMLMSEILLDGNYTRLALLATAPFLFCVSIFFSVQIVSNITMCIGPVAQYHENSMYYSAVASPANKEVDSKLPHVTIEMPVYKESLTETIAPSVYSLKKAMQTYARQGGTSSIFIHDDGLQLISDAERLARTTFYSDHNIGYVARPAHSGQPDGYKRAGRFKKASNMNYGLALSLKLEKHLARLDAGEVDPAEVSGEAFEDKALLLAIEETYAESGNRWRPWAANGKSIRMGEVVLIVDSDTIVPEDCLRDAARELHECPEVAIIQHESDVMQVAHHYFENGIAHFTRRINKCISMATANGEVAPFVGHNAFLRWSAIQDAAFVDTADGVKKIWSESNVSEDFDMALRLQLKGYIIRWATYSSGGFKEGVSLTPDDELNRWEKYSYGCNELIFNPLISWWRLGPINKQLRIFLWSDAPVHYKISMMAYMFSYYGIAAGFILTVMNYFILGWGVEVDGFYLHSFEVWLACLVVFPCAGSVAFTLLEYRLGQRSLLSSALETVTWIPFFFFFFGGLSIHLSKALLAHMFSYDIQWGATKKEVERSNFFIEVPRIIKRFRIALALAATMITTAIVLATNVVPAEWRMPPKECWAILLPLMVNCISHILFPIVLNPWLMIFSY